MDISHAFYFCRWFFIEKKYEINLEQLRMNQYENEW